MRYYLGIHCGHDATASLVNEKGDVIAAIAEERVTRVKFHSGFPYESMNEVLRIAGLEKTDITHISASTKRLFYPGSDAYNNYMLSDDKALKKQYDLSNLPNFESKGQKIIKIFKSKLSKKEESLSNEEIETFTYNTLKSKLDDLGFTNYEFEIFDHHACHAASAYYAGGKQDALLITVDGAGDGKCATASIGKNGSIELISTASADCSPGRFYSSITRFLGYKRNRHEGKITGLAAFGNPQKYYNDLKQFMRFNPEKEKFEWDMPKESGIKRKFKTLNRILKDQNFGNPYIDYFHEYLTQNFDPKKDAQDLSAAVQYITEEVVTEYIEHFRKKYPAKNIEVAGGIFANVKVNQKIRELPNVDYIYVHQNMGDGGCALGASYLQWAAQHPNEIPARPLNVYYGPEYSNEDIENALKAYGEKIKYQKFDEVEIEIAKRVHDGKIIGRFNGRMEYGPRALGNRTIIVKTTDRSINDWLNKRLKRTEFMPFAPSVIDEGAAMLFHDYELGKSDYTDQFMTITYDVKKEWHDKMQAAVHVDNTARPQIVTEAQNPSYYKILKKYYELSGIPTFVNTSFNTHEEPIVMTPDDAIRSFLSGTVDLLAIGDFIVENNN